MNVADPQTSLPAQASLKRRTVYARAMGIDVWMPRRPIPEAPAHYVSLQSAARRQDIPKDSGSDSTPKTHSNTQSRSLQAPALSATEVKGRSQLKSLLRETEPEHGLQASAVDRNRVNSSRGHKDSNELANFELSVITMHGLLVVDDTTHARGAGSAYLNWLNALSLALGRSSMLEMSHVDRLSWPEIIGGAQAYLAKSSISERQQAQEMTAVWLSQKLTNKDVSSVLLMGQAANELFDTDHLSALGQHSARWRDIQFLRSPASASAWRDSAAKRELWQVIAPLSL